jgi:hypothetical protein
MDATSFKRCLHPLMVPKVTPRLPKRIAATFNRLLKRLGPLGLKRDGRERRKGNQGRGEVMKGGRRGV